MASDYQEIMVMLTGGLNTAENPSQLEPNELQEMTGLEYRPPRTGIFGCQGRSRYDSTAAGGVNMGGSYVHGLVFAQFDVSASATSGSGQRLFSFSGSSAFSAVATGQTADFTTIKRNFTTNATAFADGVHYANNWFFWNGKDNSWLVSGTALTASAQHGLIGFQANITAVATASAGNVNDTGTFDVWMTECYAASESGILTNIPSVESVFDVRLASVKSVNLSATGEAIQVTYPGSTTNGSNIFFRTYVSVPGGKFPYGFARLDAIASSVFGTTANIVPVGANDYGNEAYPVVQPPGGVGVSANSRPPNPYDMAVFQDSLVAIDADNRQIINYSLADSPHYFPSVYYIPFETEWQDKLTALETCNNALLVFSSYYGYRVDDLPRSTDGDDIISSRGRIKEPFSYGHGAIGPRCTAKFNVFGSGELCLFVCRDGVHITDGFKTDYATNCLDWENTVHLAASAMERYTLKNNPKRHRIEFRYYDKADLGQWKRLDFYYHPKFLKHGEGERAFPELPLGGPTDIPGPSAAVGVLNNDWQVWNGMSQTFNGVSTVWIEGTGTADNSQLIDSSFTINKRLRTKDFYFNGTNGEFSVPHALINQSATTASGSAIATLEARYDESGIYTATATVDFSKSQSQFLRFSGTNVSPDNRMQSTSIRVVKDDGGAWQELNYFTFVIDRAGKVKSAVSNV